MAIDVESRVITRTTTALNRGIKFIFHQGGTSSGKTFGILYSLLDFALKQLGNNEIISVVSENLPQLKRGAIGDFETILSSTGIKSAVKVVKTPFTCHFEGGKKIEFFSPDDEEKAKPGKRRILFINEANSVKWSIANQLMMRADIVILDWNPSSKFWLHKMLLPHLKKDQYVFTRTTYLDNIKNLPQGIIDGIELLKTQDDALYDVYGRGIEGNSKEIIYHNWEIVDEFPSSHRTAIGQDFGYTNHPSAAVRVSLYNGELWIDQLLYGKGYGNKKLAELLKAAGCRNDRVICDNAEPKSVDELVEFGINAESCSKGKDYKRFEIQRVKLFKLNITRRSVDVIDEIGRYKWKVINGEVTNEPVDKDDHAMDAIIYGAQGVIGDVSVPTVKPMSRERAREYGFTDISI